ESEVAIDTNSSRSWQLIFQSLPLVPGDRILTCTTSYTSNYLGFIAAAERTGATIETIPALENGIANVDCFKELMDQRVKVVAVTHMPTNSGLIQPVESIGAAMKGSDAIYMVDTTQSIGQVQVNVNNLNCDVLVGTSRKYLRGPRGVGFAYVRRSLAESIRPILLDSQGAKWTGENSLKMQDGAIRFETGENHPALRLGLLAAMDYHNRFCGPETQGRIRHLAETIRLMLAELPGVTVRDRGEEKSGIVTFTVTGWNNYKLRDTLIKKKINISVSPADFTLLDMKSQGLESVARASVHYYNTENELMQLCDTLRDLLRLV
ncbi:MAG: aminotransferase class V-fold PLP-dependent enzyme, partial [Chthonomonadales bacterium]